MVRNGNLNIETMEDEAVRLLDKGKFVQAERIFKKMLASDQNCLPAHFNLARLYRRTEKFKDALYHAHRTLRLNPLEKNACLNLGLIYELLGRDKLAAFYYKKELSRDPGNPETLWNFGRLCYNRHRWRLASEYLRRCFETRFQFDINDTVYKLGICYNKLRDITSYINIYSQYLQMYPNEGWALANLGCALLCAKDYQGALLRLKRAVRLGVKSSIALDLVQAGKMLKRTRNMATFKYPET